MSTRADRVPDEALRDLYEAHGKVILRYLVRLIGGDTHRAEDILQETLMRAWKHPEVCSATGEWSRAWLITVARRIAIDHARAANSRPGVVNDERLEERSQVEDGVDRLVERTVVRSAVAALPERLRDVLIETYSLDRSAVDAAQSLGVPVGTVKSRSFHTLRALRAELLARGYLPADSDSPAA